MAFDDACGASDATTLEKLHESVDELRTSVARIADEVRTRRLAIVDGSERERMVAEISEGVLEVRMDLPPGDRGRRTALVCFTAPPTAELGAGLGAQLWVDGNLVGEVGWWADQPAPGAVS